VLPRREPPGADPHARWCGDWGLTTPGYPIMFVIAIFADDDYCA